MVGRKPVPTAVKRLRGNPGKRAFNKGEPQPKRGIPACPEWLSDRAKEAWARIGADLDEMGVLTVADRTALELLVTTYDEWRTAVEELRLREAKTYESTTEGGGVIIRVYPEVGVADAAAKRLRGLLCEFGLTPSARSKVSLDPKSEEDPMAAFEKEGKLLRMRSKA